MFYCKNPIVYSKVISQTDERFVTITVGSLASIDSMILVKKNPDTKVKALGKDIISSQNSFIQVKNLVDKREQA